MIATLESLRDIGNTVIVVEHDEDTIRAADHLVEMGPGPGVHGGQVVVQGSLDDLLACKASPTGQFLSGRRSIAMPPAAPAGQRPSPHRARRPREQPQGRGRGVPARPAGGHHRRLGLGQEHAGQRDPVQGAVETAGRHPHPAGRSRRPGGRRAGPQGGQHRPDAHRPQQPLQPRHLRRLLRHHPRSVHRGARSRSNATTSRGASASTSRAGAARSARAKG